MVRLNLGGEGGTKMRKWGEFAGFKDEGKRQIG